MKNNFKLQALSLFLSKTSYKQNDIKKIIECRSSFTNKSFKFILKKTIFQVRLGCNSLIDRKNELEIYNSLQLPIIFFDIKNGNMIRPWIDGKKFKKWNNNKIQLLVSRLHEMHNIKNDKILNFNAYIFTNLLINDKNNSFYNEYIYLLNKYVNEPKDTICHCDLNPNNILFDRKNNIINLIDFEWSRKNTVYFEIANLAREKMNKKQILYLAKLYGNIDLQKLKDYLIISCLYAYQWTLSINDNHAIRKYRKHVLKRLEFFRKIVL